MCQETPITYALGQLALDPESPLCAFLRKCPVMQEYLLQKGLISVDELTTEGNFSLILLDTADLKSLTHLSGRALQDKRTKGILPYILLGNRCYYYWSDVEKWLRENYRRKTEKLIRGGAINGHNNGAISGRTTKPKPKKSPKK